MSNFARTCRGRLGDLFGDVETGIYKVMVKQHNKLTMETPKGEVSIRKSDTGARRIYLGEEPIAQCGIDVAIDVLEYLEETE
jgi:hypothetical protein